MAQEFPTEFESISFLFWYNAFLAIVGILSLRPPVLEFVRSRAWWPLKDSTRNVGTPNTELIGLQISCSNTQFSKATHFPFESLSIIEFYSMGYRCSCRAKRHNDDPETKRRTKVEIMPKKKAPNEANSAQTKVEGQPLATVPL
jgi:hypothetical protein